MPINVTLEEKIQILERFHQTGEKVSSKTIFEGHPIGSWAIQIRSSINNTSDKKRPINISKEQLSRLEAIGLLERKFDSTIDEKIDALVTWMKKYPKLKMAPPVSQEILMKYAKDDASYNKLLVEYEKMQRYYSYVVSRKYHGKLSDEQISKCKEGNVGEAFGFPTKVEQLAKQYGQSEKDINHILSTYRTMDNFYKLFTEEKLKNHQDNMLARSIVRTVIDIDFDPNSNYYDKLYLYIVDGLYGASSLSLYSSKQLKAEFQKLSEREQYVVTRRLALSDNTSPNSLSTLAKEFNLSRSTISQIEHKARRKLILKLRNYSYPLNVSMDSEFLTDSEKTALSEFQKSLTIANLSNMQNIKDNPTIVRGLEIIRAFRQRSLEPKERSSMSISDIAGKPEGIAIANLDFSIRTYNLLSRHGIKTLAELANFTVKELKNIRSLGKKSFDEVVAALEKYGLQLKEPPIPEAEIIEPLDPLSLSNLSLSTRSYNCLSRAGFTSLDQVANLTFNELITIRNLGEKSVEEIIAKLEENGFHLKDSIEIASTSVEKVPIDSTEVQETDSGNHEKVALISRILAQQQIIHRQQAEISRLNVQKKEYKDAK